MHPVRMRSLIACVHNRIQYTATYALVRPEIRRAQNALQRVIAVKNSSLVGHDILLPAEIRNAMNDKPRRGPPRKYGRGTARTARFFYVENP